MIISMVARKTAAHVELTRDGRYLLLSIWDIDVNNPEYGP